MGRRETEKLWNFMYTHDEFPFRTIEDVLQENEDCKNENRWLNDIISNNISQLADLIEKLQQETTDNSASIESNSEDITALRQETTNNDNHISDQIAENLLRIKENSANVESNSGDILNLQQETTNNENHIAENLLKIQENSANIGYNSEDIIALLPIGTVIAWIGADSASSPLPKGWQRCDGSLIVSGPMVNQNTPNLNGEAGHFLRGGTFNQLRSTHDDQLGEHTHSATATVNDPTHSHNDYGHSHGSKRIFMQ